jgi:hypothetical protein
VIVNASGWSTVNVNVSVNVPVCPAVKLLPKMALNPPLPSSTRTTGVVGWVACAWTAERGARQQGGGDDGAKLHAVTPQRSRSAAFE